MPSGRPFVTIRASEEIIDRWKAAAEKAGDSLNGFGCDALNAAAELVLDESPKTGKLKGRPKPQTEASISAAKQAGKKHCPRAHFHRTGVFCKFCCQTP